jgi:hypothetical protein
VETPPVAGEFLLCRDYNGESKSTFEEKPCEGFIRMDFHEKEPSQGLPRKAY